MSEETPTLESLELKKPLDKMTTKDLRQLCIDKMPLIAGASGMDKETIISNIKEYLGIEDEEGAVSPYKDQIISIKRKMREMRIEKKAVDGREKRSQLRRRINRMKKQTRALARAL
ncbi:hypothetical protein [Desulfovibrio sp. JC022]|uniref:hypothetical protein n=1 Tax=Desulfovibrio sp. JC022 TaxID=2593642 RepID=UPI0010AA074E|nr:hypothetical protein [Desulfovibrio sp. JC022]NDV22861.1 hypothetical protein [Desulfovibrio sp. JC022]TIH13214.1 hypothetical protein D0S45_15575 [Marinifilum sp. JC120]